MNSKRSEILKSLGNNAKTGTISVMESHMVFPIIFAEDLGITFIFQNETDDLAPTYLSVNEETNIKNINVNGANPGMKFADIIDKLGSAEVKKTWISSEDNVVYKIEYKLEGVVYSFLSYDENGTDSRLIIYLGE